MLYHCFASFKQSPHDFFKLVDSRLTLMLLYDSLNCIISGIHQSHLGCWGHRSEKVKLRGLDYVACKMWQCAVLLKEKIIIHNVFVNILWITQHNILLRWYKTSLMRSIDMQFILDEEKLQFLTWCPSGLTPERIGHCSVNEAQVCEQRLLCCSIPNSAPHHCHTEAPFYDSMTL